jgi:hypothetical protein
VHAGTSANRKLLMEISLLRNDIMELRKQIQDLHVALSRVIPICEITIDVIDCNLNHINSISSLLSQHHNLLINIHQELSNYKDITLLNFKEPHDITLPLFRDKGYAYSLVNRLKVDSSKKSTKQ